MSSTLPTRSNGYRAPHRLVLNRAVWDAVFGDVAVRLDELEVLKDGLQQLISIGSSQALAMVAETVAPQIEAVQASVDAINAAVAAAEDQLQATEAAIASLLALSLTANLVAISSPINGISAGNVAAALAEHQGDIDALEATVAGHASSIATNTSDIAANASAIAGKAPQATTYTKTEVDALIASNATSIARIMAFSS